MPIVDIVVIIVAYLMGSVSAAIIVCRIMGLPDPRTLGSKNPGATNVLRIGGKRAAAITLFGDLLKGFIPVMAAYWLLEDITHLSWVAMAAFLGHLYPIFFHFKGGKGVATAMGVMLAMVWPVALIALAIWLFMAKVWKLSSLAALTAAVCSPVVAWLLAVPNNQLVMLTVMSLLLLWRHQSNIRNILSGTEDAIAAKTDRE